MPHLPVGWGGQQITQINIVLNLSSCRVALRPACVICGTDLAECVSVLGDFLRSQGAFLPGFYHLRGSHRPAPGAPLIRGMPTGPYIFLGMPGAWGLRPCARTHLKKGLVPHLPVWWGEQQIPQINIGVIRTVRDFLPFLRNSIFLV